jgi:hypothetical protein
VEVECVEMRVGIVAVVLMRANPRVANKRVCASTGKGATHHRLYHAFLAPSDFVGLLTSFMWILIRGLIVATESVGI